MRSWRNWLGIMALAAAVPSYAYDNASDSLRLANEAYQRGEVTVAARLFNYACAEGNQRACYNAAVMLEHGEGQARDLARAVTLYQQSCTAGESGSCFNLGILYRTGHGVEHNDTHAAELFTQACDGGTAMACNNLGSLYHGGEGVTQDLLAAARYYTRACDAGAAPGCHNLGLLTMFGDGGVQQDVPRAVQLFERALSLDPTMTEPVSYLERARAYLARQAATATPRP